MTDLKQIVSKIGLRSSEVGLPTTPTMVDLWTDEAIGLLAKNDSSGQEPAILQLSEYAKEALQGEGDQSQNAIARAALIDSIFMMIDSAKPT